MPVVESSNEPLLLPLLTLLSSSWLIPEMQKDQNDSSLQQYLHLHDKGIKFIYKRSVDLNKEFIKHDEFKVRNLLQLCWTVFTASCILNMTSKHQSRRIKFLVSFLGFTIREQTSFYDEISQSICCKRRQLNKATHNSVRVKYSGIFMPYCSRWKNHYPMDGGISQFEVAQGSCRVPLNRIKDDTAKNARLTAC